ncbi:L,D-transpeptidase [Chenggangzhangella methanolivorans]|uniref:L,D-transpeptidase n=1 Tax=Chenggangzhangella methanolivorans TaxID=1437009 RepID=UPI00361C56E7
MKVAALAVAALALASAAAPVLAQERTSRAERWRDGKPEIAPATPSQIDQLNRRDFPVTLDADAPPQHVDHDETHAAIGSDYVNFLYGRHHRSPRLAPDEVYVGPVGDGHLGRRATTEGRSTRSGVYVRAPEWVRAHPGADRLTPVALQRSLKVRETPRQEVAYAGAEKPGTVIVDTRARTLTLVGASGRAIRYGVGVGREGFEWKGVQRVSAKREWPDWRPPADMLARRPDLPVHMAGGPENPLGARALYLGDTLYRIHGSNEPETIGERVSSGCIRMRNEDVIDLYDRVPVGARVVVL